MICNLSNSELTGDGPICFALTLTNRTALDLRCQGQLLCLAVAPRQLIEPLKAGLTHHVQSCATFLRGNAVT